MLQGRYELLHNFPANLLIRCCQILSSQLRYCNFQNGFVIHRITRTSTKRLPPSGMSSTRTRLSCRRRCTTRRSRCFWGPRGRTLLSISTQTCSQAWEFSLTCLVRTVFNKDVPKGFHHPTAAPLMQRHHFSTVLIFQGNSTRRQTAFEQRYRFDRRTRSCGISWERRWPMGRSLLKP